jgi:flagellar hook-associated protein 2
LLADFNAKITAAFPDARITAKFKQETAPPNDWMLVFEVDKTPPATPDEKPTWASSVSISAPPGMSETAASAMFGMLGLSALPRYTEGEFGRVIVDGYTLQVERTEFIYNDVGYELLKETPAGTQVSYSFTADSDSIVSVVREFVEAYNQLIAMIEGPLREEKSKNYKPLTDEQRADMKESEIEKWEARAKLGIMRGDANFISLGSKLRVCLFGSVLKTYGNSETIGINFESIGIFTRAYDEYGALHLDETKLRAAIDKDLDAVAQLFAKPAQIPEYDEDQSAAWNARQPRLYLDRTAGIAVRINALIDDYVRTTRNAYGVKGILIERAGIFDDMSSVNNAFSREIMQYDSRIVALWERYDRIEEKYIKTLGRLESYIQTKNVQSMWIAQQFNNYQQ